MSGQRKRGRGRTRVLTRQGLLRIKTRALRQRLWFKILSSTERAVLNLTIRCVVKVRSRVLWGIISEIVNKISRTLECGFMEMVEKTGREIAGKICEVASVWGNLRASNWRYDKGFVRFLGVTTINEQSYNSLSLVGSA